MSKGYQFVSWFPEWHVHFIRLDPVKTDMAYIYEWFWFFAFWELRKWSRLTLAAPDLPPVAPKSEEFMKAASR